MEFKYLDKEYRDDVIADALYAREVEIFHYELDKANFEHEIAKLPDGAHKMMLLKRLRQTEEQMAISNGIYAALEAQVIDPTAHAAAVARSKAKREAAKNK
jgi:hypothetical protein